MKRNKISLLVLMILAVALSIACVNVTKKLTLEEKDFYDKVSLIMTGQERKAFLSLPPEERAAFIKDFWQRRNPDPTSDRNEYKEEYYKRIDEACRLFPEGGKQGWRSDRGRIYILLGPPDRRDVYPMGYTFYEPPVEIWYYGFFPIVFIDEYKLGNYALDPGSAFDLNQINMAQIRLKSDFSPLPVDENKFEVTIQVKRVQKGNVRFQLFLPLKSIRFTLDAEKKINSSMLKVSLEIWDSKRQNKIQEQKKDFSLSLTPEEVAKLPKYIVLTMTQKLAKGQFIAAVAVENTTDKAQSRKEQSFRI